MPPDQRVFCVLYSSLYFIISKSNTSFHFLSFFFLQIFALSKFFVFRFMGGEGHRLHPGGRRRGLNPGPHLPFPGLGGHPSSPVSWVVRTTLCTQGEALGFKGRHQGLNPRLHLPFLVLGYHPPSPISWAGSHRMHPRGGTRD